MTLFEQISQSVGKTVFPIKNTGIYEFAIPAIATPVQYSFPAPKLEQTNVFRIPGAILQNVSIAPNLLFALPEIDLLFRRGGEDQ